MRVVKGLAIAGAALVLSVGGCSNVINTGGDTTCKDFLTQDEAKQNDEVSKMLKDEGKKDPSGLELTAARTAALAYCKTLGNESSTIKQGPHL
ncbi:MAG: hypothetical protein ABI253_01945 [Mycobacterium sp.]